MATATQEFIAVGRRKTATARIRIKAGTGKIEINGKDALKYFGSESLVTAASLPLTVAEKQSEFDVRILVRGGGQTGQAGAISLGLARALQKFDAELRAPLKKAGHLERDGRMKERKKPGQPGARKRFQFSKR